jgi:hypothetical protein
MATAREDVRCFILPGINEGGHQGDVDCFHDRSSAQPSPAIRMGESDWGSLGSGWHGVENPPGAVQPYRWCKSRSWFYLAKAPGSLILKASSPIAPNTLKLFAEDRCIGEERLDSDIAELRFDLPNNLPQSGLWEFRLECDTIRLADRSPGGDIRDLGLVVFEMRLE